MNLEDIKKLDYNTRVKIAIILFLVATVVTIMLFTFSMRNNFNKFNSAIKDIKDNEMINDISSTIEDSNKIKDDTNKSIEELNNINKDNLDKLE